ncbi:unnamed protein product [Moneuplotes crassus]|uniref:Uncharacterized protein n=1 Tax=Euplotes crassus TaxID=5936 RepID=A0AAD2D445_EUPCR|nr:unnamed protein product [Moneuplotes crassus]
MYSKYEPPKHAIPKLDREKMNLSELDKLKNLETCYGPHWEDAIDRNFFTANSSLKFPSSTRSSHACSTKTKLLLAKRHAKRRCLFAAQQNESNLKFHALMKKQNRYKGKNLSQISNCWSLLNGIDEYVTERREISRSKFPSLRNIDKQSQNSKYRVSLRSVSPNSINPSFIKNWEFPETIDKEKEIVEEDEVNLKTTPKFVPNLTSRKANKSVNIVFGNHPNDLSDIPRKSQAGSPTDRSHENIITGEDFSPDLNDNLLRSIPKININTEGGPLSFKKFRKMKNIYNKLAMDKLDLNTGRKSKKLAEYILGGMERQPENKSILNNPETAYSLGPKVLKSKAIRTLDLETSKLSQKGIDSLCKYLKWNKNLNSLNLARNSINNEALQYILDALEDNDNIETLDLSMNRFDSLIVADICRIIETTYIKNLTLKDNNFGRKGAFKIAQILLTETSKNILERVDFSCIKSDAEGTAKILECLAKGHTIKSFTYDRNRISTPKAWGFLRTVISSNALIQYLSLA